MKNTKKTKEQLTKELKRLRKEHAKAQGIAEKCRKMGKVLQESEEKFRAIYNESAMGIALTDLNGRFLDSNRAFQKILGYTAAEIKGKNYSDVTHSDDVEQEHNLFRQLIAGKRSHVQFVKRYVRKNGELIYANVTGSIARDLHGTPRFVVGMAEDISNSKKMEKKLREYRDNLEKQIKECTAELEVENARLREENVKRKRTEETLRDEEERYRMLVDLTPDIIYRLNEDGRITFISSAIEQLGYNREELIGKAFEELVHPEDRAKSSKQFTEFRVGDRRTKDLEVRLLEKNSDKIGHDYDLRFRSIQLNSRGKWNVPDEEIKRPEKTFLYTQGIARDITEHKQIEEALKRAKNMAETTSRTKSAFLANMSHELRTPLNSIIGFSEVLHDQAFGPLNEKQTQYVSHVLTAGRHLLDLINDILDLSKIDAGKMTLELSPVQLKSLLENSMVMIRERMLKHAQSLELNMAEELADVAVQADERKLKQIMFNLFSNAAKFTPDGGRIMIRVVRLLNMIQVSVADTGIGIKPEDHERIFEEFEQGDSSYAKQQQGTGLGLALTRRMVELHGGRIWVESGGEGKGSTFHFVIPLEHVAGDYAQEAGRIDRIEWMTGFSVGVNIFDRQHRRLVGMINALIEVREATANADLISHIIKDLVHYAEEHFHDEEQLMSQHGYPLFDRHVQQHRAFAAKTQDFLKETTQQDQSRHDKLLVFLRDWLVHWLVHHILSEDMKYKPFFAGKGVS